jgi:simple sugar transport system permease protein
MSATDTAPSMAPLESTPRRPLALLESVMQAGNRRLIITATVLLTLLSIARIQSGENGVTSASTVGAALRLTVPILLAGLAGLWAERCGVLNIGIEGMMILGTWFGAWGAWKFGPWVGLLMGIAGGMLGGLIHAVATVRFNIDQVISGVVMNLLGLYGARYLSDWLYSGRTDAGVSQSPQQKYPIPKFDVPFLSGGHLFGWKTPNIAGWLEKRHWFFIGDIGGIVHGVTSNLSWATVIAITLVPVSAWVLWRTRFGLRLRSSGEAPTAAETLGVKVIRVRYAGLLISGGFAGLGGATLSIVASSYYRQGQTAGRGFIGLATMIFGNWRPLGVLGGAGVFGYAEAIKFVARDSIPALFLFITFVAGLMLIIAMLRRKTITAISAFVAGGLFLTAYLTVNRVPESLAQSVPYVTTLIVLSSASQRLRPPAQAGVPYRPGESH